MNVPHCAPALAFLVLASTSALAAVGDIFITGNVTSTTNGQIYRVNPAGGVTSVASGLSRPFGLAIDFAGTFYTSDTSAGTITKISGGIATPFASGLSTPRGMECDSEGNLYIATLSTITKITPGGVVSTFDSGFSSLYDISFDAAGSMYVDDFALKRIYKYTLGVKSVVTTLTASGTTYGIEMTSAGDLFITQGPGRSIVKYSSAGVESNFYNAVSPYQPIGIESNSAGEIFIGTNGEVRKYSADGATETTLASGLVFTGMMTMQVVPEPASVSLLGLAGFAFLARRSRRSQC